MDLILRNETESEYFAVENLTREAFWNVYRPGCDEHLIAHTLRGLPCCIRELDFVAEAGGRLVGSIFYTKSKLVEPNGNERAFASFGPISVHPDFQNRRIGSALIRRTLPIAERMGYRAIFITGNPAYYGRFGFRAASDFGIRLKGVPAGEKAEFFMVKPLKEDALKGLSGVFEFDACYEVDRSRLGAFDKRFPPKVKEKRPGQIFG